MVSDLSSINRQQATIFRAFDYVRRPRAPNLRLPQYGLADVPALATCAGTLVGCRTQMRYIAWVAGSCYYDGLALASFGK